MDAGLSASEQRVAIYAGAIRAVMVASGWYMLSRRRESSD